MRPALQKHTHEASPGRCGAVGWSIGPYQRAAGSMPGQGTCPGFGLDPWLGSAWEATDRCPPTPTPLLPSPSFPLLSSSKINLKTKHRHLGLHGETRVMPPRFSLSDQRPSQRCLLTVRTDVDTGGSFDHADRGGLRSIRRSTG